MNAHLSKVEQAYANAGATVVNNLVPPDCVDLISNSAASINACDDQESREQYMGRQLLESVREYGKPDVGEKRFLRLLAGRIAPLHPAEFKTSRQSASWVAISRMHAASGELLNAPRKDLEVGRMVMHAVHTLAHRALKNG